MQNEIQPIAVGHIVKWWTRYADDIVHEAGSGLVLNINEMEYHSANRDSLVKYKNFDVYRFKFNDIMSINQQDIEFLKE